MALKRLPSFSVSLICEPQAERRLYNILQMVAVLFPHFFLKRTLGLTFKVLPLVLSVMKHVLYFEICYSSWMSLVWNVLTCKPCELSQGNAFFI